MLIRVFANKFYGNQPDTRGQGGSLEIRKLIGFDIQHHSNFAIPGSSRMQPIAFKRFLVEFCYVLLHEIFGKTSSVIK